MRSHKRFAVRHGARLRGSSNRAVSGLLIELSLDGCRIGNVDDRKFTLGQLATVIVDGFEAMEGHVRWSKDGCVGLRFLRPLHMAALETMIGACRENPALRAIG